jgi:hypothetical protein
MCGGPTQSQKNAAASQAQISAENQALGDQALSGALPFYQQEAQQGLPYFAQQANYSTSALAQQINQAKANENAKMAGYGGALPSGFAQANDRDLDIAGANAQDQNMLQLLAAQQAAKQAGAAGEVGIGQGAMGTAAGANQSIMQAPLQNNFWSNLIAGLVQGGSQMGSAALLAG